MCYHCTHLWVLVSLKLIQWCGSKSQISSKVKGEVSLTSARVTLLHRPPTYLDRQACLLSGLLSVLPEYLYGI